MKKLYAIIYLILLICVIGTAIFLILSPDRIPAHYNFAGKVDRIGSKYESLTWPIFAVVFGAFFMILAKQQGRKNEKTNEKTLLYVGISIVVLQTLLGFYFMVKAIYYNTEAAPQVPFNDVNRFFGLGAGALFVVLGNIMPKIKRNAFFGLRTKWSMTNDSVWQKSQRFGGIASVIAGLCMIILSLIVPGVWNIVLLTTVMIILLILCIEASRRYYLKDKDMQI